MKTVTLNKNEVYIASIVGIRRNIMSRDSKECNKVQNKDFGWHIDIEAAGAEIAFAKYMNLYWDFSVNTFKKPDVGGYQGTLSVEIGGQRICLCDECAKRYLRI